MRCIEFFVVSKDTSSCKIDNNKIDYHHKMLWNDTLINSINDNDLDKYLENHLAFDVFCSFSDTLQVGIEISCECVLQLNCLKFSSFICISNLQKIFLQFIYFNRVPDQYICYLNDTEYPTAKFDPKQDQPGDPGWSCITSDEKECIPKRFICDKTNDCSYGSDELKGCDLYPGIK